MKNKLIEKAEDFIIAHDINANIIKDGKIKQGAKLLAEFAEDYHQCECLSKHNMDEITDVDIKVWALGTSPKSNLHYVGLLDGAKAHKDGKIKHKS